MTATLTSLTTSGCLRRVDTALAAWIARAWPGATTEALLAAALAARAVADGHSALALDQAQAWLAALADGKAIALPSVAAWRAGLRNSPGVREFANEHDSPSLAPLVLDPQNRVYLRRYFEYERELASALVARAKLLHDGPHPNPPPPAGEGDAPTTRVGAANASSVPAGEGDERTTRVAAANASSLPAGEGDAPTTRVAAANASSPPAGEGDEPTTRAGAANASSPLAGEGDEPTTRVDAANASSPPAGEGDGLTTRVDAGNRGPVHAGREDAHAVPTVPSPRSRGEVPAGQRGAASANAVSGIASLDPEQQHAIATALTHRFTLITGGPGTGKTHSVARILAALATDADRRGSLVRIALAAPTGKAAARLTEALHAQLSALALPAATAAQLPDAASTLHRLLGISPWRTQPRCNRDAPLPYDVVVVDEVSMVDLPLMAKLVGAVPAHARLILLGDPGQLAAVEAGNVLGELVAAAAGSGPLHGCRATLAHSHRFSADSALGALAAAITAGNADAALDVLAHGEGVALAPHATVSALVETATGAYQAVLAADSPAAALTAARRFRVLTALRRGPAGCDALDRAIAARLQRGAGIGADARWWRGRLLMVTTNRDELGLFNGDTGVVWPDTNGQWQAWFDGPGATPRAFPVAALPAHEGAFALTVHKAQGSEFNRVALVTGPDSAVLTRELLYTGVTRARARVEVYSTAAIVRAGIERPSVRFTGLADRLREAALGLPEAT